MLFGLLTGTVAFSHFNIHSPQSGAYSGCCLWYRIIWILLCKHGNPCSASLIRVEVEISLYFVLRVIQLPSRKKITLKIFTVTNDEDLLMSINSKKSDEGIKYLSNNQLYIHIDRARCFFEICLCFFLLTFHMF